METVNSIYYKLKTNMAKEKISITMDAKIKKKLDREAKVQRRSFSSLVEHIADEYIKKNKLN